MSTYVPIFLHLWEVSIFCFNMKKSVALKMLGKTNGDGTISGRTCRESFQCLKNGDFDVKDQHGSGRQNMFAATETDEDSHRTSLSKAQYSDRQVKVILQQVISRPHVTNSVKIYMEMLK
ncbi:uncharacterized protein LOC124608391 [Schistocerca americana]|uniref:uncharacterized protein LOC124608391 n=1 Tax=Schistocerca americana TaxID=7009 RepID=UPI001F503C60|nr:uncharacterized protein LOC124608391 [Schistocerca americana]